MSSMRAELRAALLRLLRAPAFAAAALTMLALGFGLTVAMVCTVDGVLLRGLPLPAAQRLVSIYADNPSQQVHRAQLSIAEAEQLASGTAGFDALGYFQWTGLGVLEDGHPREIPTQLVSVGYFDTLGLAPALGRFPNAQDIRAGLPLAVISWDEWHDRFGGSAAVIGRRLETLDRPPLEIVGVMPAAMRSFSGDTGVWTALRPQELPQDAARRLDLRILQMVGRLRADATPAQADEALAAQLATLDQAHGRSPAHGWRLRTRGLLDLIVGPVRSLLWGALALALMVLLIGCANVASLIDARQVARRRELAVMQAIGASRARLRRGTLLELLWLGAAALLLGTVIAEFGLSMLRALAADSVPRAETITLDWRVAAIVLALGAVLPMVAALAGSLRVDADPLQAMRSAGKGVVGDGRRQRLLPATAMALSTVCLLAAAGLGLGLLRLQGVDPGFRSAGVHALSMFREALGTDSGGAGPAQWNDFGDAVLQRLAAVPGAQGAALTSAAPLSQIGGGSADVRIAGVDAVPVQAALRRVSAGYNGLLDIALLAGRDFDGNDRAGAEPVAIVNRTLARRLFGDTSPLDRSIDLPLGRSGRSVCRIVGVVADVHNDRLRAAALPEVLVPFAQAPRVAMTFLLRSDPALPGIDTAMANALWSVDPRQTITAQYTLQQRIDDELRPLRFFARVVTGFAFAALVLAVFGVYAVAALQQRRRIAEFGLRLAVGATPSRLARGILGASLIVSSLGVGAGCAIAAVALRWFDPSRLAGAIPLLPVFVGGTAAMMLAALLAAALPAWRVLRVTPLEALRDE